MLSLKCARLWDGLGADLEVELPESIPSDCLNRLYGLPELNGLPANDGLPCQVGVDCLKPWKSRGVA